MFNSSNSTVFGNNEEGIKGAVDGSGEKNQSDYLGVVGNDSEFEDYEVCDAYFVVHLSDLKMLIHLLN